jgi:hypothetical protein
MGQPASGAWGSWAWGTIAKAVSISHFWGSAPGAMRHAIKINRFPTKEKGKKEQSRGTEKPGFFKKPGFLCEQLSLLYLCARIKSTRQELFICRVGSAAGNVCPLVLRLQTEKTFRSPRIRQVYLMFNVITVERGDDVFSHRVFPSESGKPPGYNREISLRERLVRIWLGNFLFLLQNLLLT